MQSLRASQFVAVARALSEASAAAGLPVLGFRTPPRTPGVQRAVRRGPGGTTTVLIRRAGVAADEVVENMVAGVLHAAEVAPDQAAALRPRLMAAAWSALDRRQAAVTSLPTASAPPTPRHRAA